MGNVYFGTGNWFCCGTDEHKVRYYSTVAARGREDNQVPPRVVGNDAPRRIICMHSGLGDKSWMMKMMLVSCIFFL